MEDRKLKHYNERVFKLPKEIRLCVDDKIHIIYFDPSFSLAHLSEYLKICKDLGLINNEREEII